MWNEALYMGEWIQSDTHRRTKSDIMLQLSWSSIEKEEFSTAIEYFKVNFLNKNYIKCPINSMLKNSSPFFLFRFKMDC